MSNVVVKKGVVEKETKYKVPGVDFEFSQKDLEDPAPFNFENKRAFFNYIGEKKEEQQS